MSSKLSLEQAAKVIFACDSVTPEQVTKVRRLMQRRALKGDTSNRDISRWTTSEQQVAEFLAQQSYAKDAEASKQAGRAGRAFAYPRQGAPGGGPNDTIGTVYQEILKDYFLAVILRRKRRYAGKWFDRSVLLGQAVLLLIIATGVVLAFRRASKPPPAENRAIEQWLSDNYEGEVRDVRFFPPFPSSDGDGVVIRTQFSYPTKNRRRVQSERYFVMRGEQIIRVESEL